MTNRPSPSPIDGAPRHVRPSGGRPTKAAAAERDERVLAIATRMFMEQGFDATSIDGLAEAAAVGKATLYARYADKAALLAAVLQHRILEIYAPLEDELNAPAVHALDPAATLRLVAYRLLDHSISPDVLAMSRILTAQSVRFPELAQLAVREGAMRQTRLIAAILGRFATPDGFRTDDLEQAADLFLSIAIGRAARLALLGIPVDAQQLRHRADMAVDVFLNGLLR